MTPKRDELRTALERVDAPAPRPEFVERLGHRLQALDQTTPGKHTPVFKRPPAFGFLALGAVAVVVALLFGMAGKPTDPRLDVTGQPPAGQPEQGEPGPTAPPPSTTTSVVGGPVTTVVPTGGPATTLAPSAPAPNAVVPVLPPGPTERPTTDTTRPRSQPTTTTTAPPPAEPETLALTCVAGQPEGRPGIQCDWAQSTSAAFASYRVWRRTGSEAQQVVTTIPVRTITRYIDRPAAGVYDYMVEALDGQSRVVGRTAIVEVTCC